MCGITGYIGNSNKTYYLLLKGLKQLQNRGYDSAGICTINENTLILNKFASNNNETGINKLEKIKHNCSNIGIGHTRWATHGFKTDINSHPHLCMYNEIAIVHNGIIENFAILKKKLIKHKYTFKSETDSEVIVNLLSYEWKKNNNFKMAINNTINQLEGTYALCILNIKIPKKLFCVCNGSPLLISKTEKECYIASEQSGLMLQTNSYICIQNKDIIEISINEKNNIEIKTNKKYINKEKHSNNISKTFAPYKNWMIKEIYEQTDVYDRCLNFGARILNNKVKLGGLEIKNEELKEINNIILLGCGTSYYSGLTCISYFKTLCNFNTIQIFDGADFSENDIPKIGNTAFILLSQSGETKDLHRCINIGRKNNILLIGVVNVVDSLISRETDCGCYLNAGREVAVASTKSFFAQCIVLSLISIWFSQIQNINHNIRNNFIKDLRKLKFNLQNVLHNEKIYDKISKLLYKKNNLFILGKGKNIAIAKEGSLKIKEVCYIHAEGYSGSSLKHGPFGLLTKGFPVILIDTISEYYSKMNNVYNEVKCREADIILITNNNIINEVIKENTNIENKSNQNKEQYKNIEEIIKIPYNNTYSNLLSIIPIQIIAYKISLLKGINPDFPRNLAKVVTVE